MPRCWPGARPSSSDSSARTARAPSSRRVNRYRSVGFGGCGAVRRAGVRERGRRSARRSRRCRRRVLARCGRGRAALAQEARRRSRRPRRRQRRIDEWRGTRDMAGPSGRSSLCRRSRLRQRGAAPVSASLAAPGDSCGRPCDWSAHRPPTPTRRPSPAMATCSVPRGQWAVRALHPACSRFRQRSMRQAAARARVPPRARGAAGTAARGRRARAGRCPGRGDAQQAA